MEEIAYDEKTVINNMRSLVDLKGKRVLELGGNLNEDIVRECGVVEWVSVDPMKEDYISKDRVYKCYKMPLLDFKLLEGHFDCVYSSNALEHVNNLRQCLMYIYNSLKPSGGFFAHFGPIWSAPDGHHLENVKLKDGTILNFWDNNIIPKWYHLLYGKGNLKEFLSSKLSEDDAKTVVDYIYESNYLNRLFFRDYVNCFLDTGFEIKELLTTGLIDYEMKDYYKSNYEDSEARELLKKTYGNDDYDCRDIMVLLRRT